MHSSLKFEKLAPVAQVPVFHSNVLVQREGGTVIDVGVTQRGFAIERGWSTLIDALARSLRLYLWYLYI